MDVATIEKELASARMEAHAIVQNAGDKDLTDAAATRFDELATLIKTKNEELREHASFLNQDLEKRRNEMVQSMRGLGNEDRGNGGQFLLERGAAGDYDRDPLGDPASAHASKHRNPWDLSEVRFAGPRETAAELRARALTAVERMPGANDAMRQAATDVLERFDSVDSRIARHALITSNPAYLRAWAKLARDEQYALDQDEVRALREAEQHRAMSLTDSAGGYLVPFQLDPAVIVTSSGSYSEITSVCRQVIATGDVWNGVTSAAISWSWDAEAAEVSDDSPTFGSPSVPIHKAQGFVPISMEALMDAANVTEEIGRLFTEGQQDLEAVTLITGSGSGQPTGVVTALAASSPTVIVNAASDDTFAIGDVYSLQGALPAKFRRNASFLANNQIYNNIRRFDTAGGGGYWANLNDGRPPQLLGRSAIEAEAMDGTITTSGANHNYALIFGDFQNYVVARRLGMTVELVPHLFHTANNRPSGQRGWLAWYRVGADSVNDNAFRMLDIVSAS